MCRYAPRQIRLGQKVEHSKLFNNSHSRDDYIPVYSPLAVIIRVQGDTHDIDTLIPDCGTSRNVLAFIRAAGYNPIVVDCLSEGWTRPQLLALFAAANLRPSEAPRKTKSPTKELGLLENGLFENHILQHMTEHPIMVN